MRKIRVMGILNVTPDSFSDGGRFFDTEAAVRRGIEMAEEGADIIDVGGESTRPGAADISVDEELGRVIPVIEALAREVKVAVSVDTRKSEVAKEATAAGAKIINDVSGLSFDEKIADVAAAGASTIILMHMKGTPRDMQDSPRYINLIEEISESLKLSISKALNAGVGKDKIIIDPGIGFGKSVEHNIEILGRLKEFKKSGYPLCVGVSRKSFIGRILNVADPSDRLAGSLAAGVMAVLNGADILRAHDVSDTRQAVDMVSAIKSALGE